MLGPKWEPREEGALPALLRKRVECRPAPGSSHGTSCFAALPSAASLLCCCSLLTRLGLSRCFLAFETVVEPNIPCLPWSFGNLAGLQSPVIASNTALGVAVRYCRDVVKVHNQSMLSEGDFLKIIQ